MTRSRYSKDVRALNPHLDTHTRRQAAARSGNAPSDEADTLLAEIARLAKDLPLPERDHPFGSFKMDLAWPDARLCVEVNGGFSNARGGKHGTDRDHVKMRRIVLAGWRTLVFTANEVRCDPLGCIEDIRTALRG